MIMAMKHLFFKNLKLTTYKGCFVCMQTGQLQMTKLSKLLVRLGVCTCCLVIMTPVVILISSYTTDWQHRAPHYMTPHQEKPRNLSVLFLMLGHTNTGNYE